jgi:hypothetical protein
VTIQELGSVGELVAAIATVLTLGYLAVQIRGNTRAMAAESQRSSLTSATDAVIALAANRGLAEVFNNGLRDLESLDAVDSTRFTMIVSHLVAQSQLTYSESNLGIDSTYLATTATGLKFLLAPGGRQWWQKNNQNFLPEFVSWLNEEIGLSSEIAAQQGDEVGR